MIRKVYEADPMVCPKCGSRMKVVAFLTEPEVVDRIIRHLELTFAAGAFRPNAKRKFLFRAVTLDTLGTVPFGRAHGRPV